MAWNDDGNGKDPWQRDGQQPADLDQVVQEWQKRLGSILGGGGAAGGAGGAVFGPVIIFAWVPSGFCPPAWAQ